jgi:predicted dehydrogenase
MTDRRSAIRVGVVGLGRVTAQQHLPNLATLPGMNVIALADTDRARLDEVAVRHSIPRRFLSHADLIAGTDVDAVVVATPPSSHGKIGLDVIEAGKHLFVDKPVAMDLAECDRLREAAGQRRGTVLVGHNHRWHRLAGLARQTIRSGVLGEIKAVRSLYTHAHSRQDDRAWHRLRALGGGVLFNNGVHHFDLWRFLLGADVAQVLCDCTDSAHFEDDTCTVSARLTNGALASAVLSFSTTDNSQIEVFGEAGALLIDFYRFDGLQFTPRGTLTGGGANRVRRCAGFLRSLPLGLAAARRGGDFNASYAAMWRHWADCLLRDATPGCTLTDGRAAVAVALACRESAATGRTVCPQ